MSSEFSNPLDPIDPLDPRDGDSDENAPTQEPDAQADNSRDAATESAAEHPGATSGVVHSTAGGGGPTDVRDAESAGRGEASMQRDFAAEPDPRDIVARLPGDQLEWLHPSSLFFDLIAHVRSLIVPALIGVFSAAQGSYGGVAFAIAIFVPAVMTAIFRYLTLRYTILDDKLVVMRGLIFRRVRTVPVARIQNIDLIQNPLHRILGVAEVRIETASGTEAEAVLRVLTLEQVERLRSGVTARRQMALPSAPLGQTTSTAVEPSDAINQPPSTLPDRTLLEIPVGWLVRAGLASNRGVLIIGVAWGAMYEFDLWDRVDWEHLDRFIPEDWTLQMQILAGAAALVGLLVLMRIVSVGWFILRFHGYRLARRDGSLRISCGLLTRVSATVPIRRVQFVSVHQNLFMRWMGMASIRIETAGGAGKENEDAAATVARRWFVPSVPIERVPSIVQLLHEDLTWDPDQWSWKPLARGAAHRMCRIAVAMAVVVEVTGIMLWQPWGWLAGVVALPVFLVIAVKKSRSMRLARTDFGIAYRSGVWTRKTSVAFFEKIQALRLTQNLFDRRWNMATLEVDTAAAGPADHRIDVRFLDEQFARQEFEEVRHQVAIRKPKFA